MKKFLLILCIISTAFISGCLNNNSSNTDDTQNQEITFSDVDSHSSRTVVPDSIVENYELGRGFNTNDLSSAYDIALKRSDIIFTQSEDIGNDYHFYEDVSYDSLKKSFTNELYVGAGYKGTGASISASLEGKLLNYTSTQSSSYTGIVSYTYKYGNYSIAGFDFKDEEVKKLFYSNPSLFELKYGNCYLKSVDVGIKCYIIIQVSSSSNYNIASSEWKAACKIAIKNLFGGKLKIDTSGSTATSEELAKTDCVLSISTFDNSDIVISPANINADSSSLNNYLNSVILKFDDVAKYKPLRRTFNRYPFDSYNKNLPYLKKWFNLEEGLIQVYNDEKLYLSPTEWTTFINYISIVNDAIYTLYEKGVDGLKELPDPNPIEIFINKTVTRKTLDIFITKLEPDCFIKPLKNSPIVIKSKSFNKVIQADNYSLYLQYLPSDKYTIYPLEMPWKKYSLTIDSRKNNYAFKIIVSKFDMFLRSLYTPFVTK